MCAYIESTLRRLETKSESNIKEDFRRNSLWKLEVARITQDKPNHRVCVSCIEPSDSVIINLIVNVQGVNFNWLT
jgi:hypothetical protein